MNEITVTPEMLAAGYGAFFDFDPITDDSYEMLAAVFIAMRQAQLQQSPESPPETTSEPERPRITKPHQGKREIARRLKRLQGGARG